MFPSVAWVDTAWVFSQALRLDKIKVVARLGAHLDFQIFQLPDCRLCLACLLLDILSTRDLLKSPEAARSPLGFSKDH